MSCLQNILKWVRFSIILLILGGCAQSIDGSDPSDPTTDLPSETKTSEIEFKEPTYVGEAFKQFLLGDVESNICELDPMVENYPGFYITGKGQPSTLAIGAAYDSVQLDSEDDFCLDQSGEIEKSELDIDNEGKFVQFIFSSEWTGTCDEEEFGFTRGFGYMKQTELYGYEVYGRFEMIDETILNCTLRYSKTEDGIQLDINDSKCTDDNEEEVELTIFSDPSHFCELSIDDPVVESPTFIEGHLSLDLTYDGNVGYYCTAFDLRAPQKKDGNFYSFESDCSALTDGGVEVEFLPVKVNITDPNNDHDYSDLVFEFEGDPAELSLAIFHARQAGLFTGLIIDPYYDDEKEVPSEIVDDDVFREKLAVFLNSWANFAQINKVDYFAPISQSDIFFVNSIELNDESLQSIVKDLEGDYQLMYIASTFDTSFDTNYIFDHFDVISLVKSPTKNQILIDDELDAEISNLKFVVDNYNEKHQTNLTTNLFVGVLGDAAENHSFANWYEDDYAAKNFYSHIIPIADKYGIDGLVGIEDELSFLDNPLSWEVVSAQF